MTALGNFSSKRKENYDFSLVNEKVALIPYRRHHVAKYHTWMCDPSILEATASEPLSLDEEYAMQRTWRDDATKITFIIALGDALGADISEEKRIVGDVNLFLHDLDDKGNAEIEVMVAETSARRRGLAKEALIMLMQYGIKFLAITRFFAKIGADNSASLNLFQQQLQYEPVNYVEAFREHELAFKVTPESTEHLATLSQHRRVPYVDLPFAPPEARDPED